jgi:acyl-CoA-binding protein
MNDEFQFAVSEARLNTSLKFSNEEKLLLYGLYKFCTFGYCKTEKPWAINMVATRKWESWNNVSLTYATVDDAIDKYVALVTSKLPCTDK